VEKSFTLFFEKVLPGMFVFTKKKTIKISNKPADEQCTVKLSETTLVCTISRPTLNNIQQFKNYSNSYKSLCGAAKRQFYCSKTNRNSEIILKRL